MTPATGFKAPDFTLPTIIDGKVELISLSKYSQICNVVLLFFPMAFTKDCTHEMCSVSHDYTRYVDLGAVVLGISGDNPYAQAAWAAQEEIGFLLLSDYEHTVSRRYDVAYDQFLPEFNLPMGGVSKRSAFVVDMHGVLQYSECHDDPSILPDFDAITAKLEELAVPH